jgi:hypothetical protein
MSLLHAVPYIRKSLRLENTQGSLQSGIPGFSNETWGLVTVMVWAATSWYFVGPVITFHDRITAREYADRLSIEMHHMIQTLFPNNDAVFQEDSTPIHTAETVQSLLEDNDGELQHLPSPAQSPDLNIIEPFWSALETRMRNRFPPPTALKQLEHVLQEEWYKISLWSVQYSYESTARRNADVLKARKVVQHHINKDT